MAVTFALIGSGNRARQYVSALNAVPDISLCAVWGPTRPLVEALAQRAGASAYTDLPLLLSREKPDAVIIATPDFTHGQLIPLFLEKGIHVLTEKPLAMTWDEWNNIRTSVAGKTNATLSIANPYLHCRAFQQLAQDLKTGRSEEIFFVESDWEMPASYPTKKLRWSYMTSPLFHLIPYAVDFSLQIVEDMPGTLFAAGTKKRLLRLGIDTEDRVVAILQFSDGKTVLLHAGWMYPSTHPLAHRKIIKVISQRTVYQVDFSRSCPTMSDPVLSEEQSTESESESHLLGQMLLDFVEKIRDPANNYENTVHTLERARLLLYMQDALRKKGAVSLDV